MATTPAHLSTPRIGAGTVSTANTNRDGTGTIATILTGAAAGTRVLEIVVQGTGDLADGIITIFLYDGSTYYLWDEIDTDNPSAGSATVTAGRWVRQYQNLVLPSASWSVRAAITAAPTSGVANVFVLGGDLT